MSHRVCLLWGHSDTVLPLSEGLAAYSRQNGPWRIEMHALDDPRAVPWLCRGGYEGFVCISEPPEMVTALAAEAPVVVAGDKFAGPESVAVAVSDNQAVGALGAKHLIECGYRRFAYVGCDATWSMDRYEGFTDALAKQRFTCISNRQGERWPTYHDLRSEEFVAQFVARLPRPITIMGCDDLVARIIADICNSMHLRIPEDVAIIGVNNEAAYCEADAITLSTIDLNLKQLGFEAGRQLAILMKDPQAPRETTLVPPAQVICRRSTGMYAFEDPDIATAMRYIHEHACEGITVEQVCRTIAVSRRQFERRFAEMVGRSPGEEIRMVRIDLARDLLSRSDTPITDIAVQCGYEHLTSFSLAFRSATGQTPSEYRRRTAAKIARGA